MDKGQGKVRRQLSTKDKNRWVAVGIIEDAWKAELKKSGGWNCESTRERNISLLPLSKHCTSAGTYLRRVVYNYAPWPREKFMREKRQRKTAFKETRNAFSVILLGNCACGERDSDNEQVLWEVDNVAFNDTKCVTCNETAAKSLNTEKLILLNIVFANCNNIKKN